MKILARALALFVSLASSALVAGPVQLKVEPEHSFILREESPEVCFRIDLTGAGLTQRRRVPLNLSIIIDRSGSMAGAKIEKAKQAAMLLVDQLTPDDFFSVVAYDSTVDVLCPSQHVEDKESVREMISRIRPLQGTALYAGLSAGAKELRKHYSTTRLNRAILLSDGLANVGPSSPRDLRNLARELASESLSVTTIGVGDDYNEELMAELLFCPRHRKASLHLRQRTPWFTESCRFRDKHSHHSAEKCQAHRIHRAQRNL
jgi:Ca-activated chloride channel family protein